MRDNFIGDVAGSNSEGDVFEIVSVHVSTNHSSNFLFPLCFHLLGNHFITHHWEILLFPPINTPCFLLIYTLFLAFIHKCDCYVCDHLYLWSWACYHYICDCVIGWEYVPIASFSREIDFLLDITSLLFSWYFINRYLENCISRRWNGS